MAAASGRDIGGLLRELAPQALASVLRRYRDFAAAEDAVQEALIAAAQQWPESGLPEVPRAWLVRVALRRMADRMRSDRAREERETAAGRARQLFVVPAFDPEDNAVPDDALQLLFLCCHAALAPASAIALTLRAVGGLTTTEIASAFLVSETTMGQRISRAKSALRAAGARFRTLSGHERAARLGQVLHVLYLIFNEGYTATTGEALARLDLSVEAIRLARVMRVMLPDDAEVAGLLALMLLTDARRESRTGAHGELIPLDEQDRTLWNRDAIAEGAALLAVALEKGSIGSYTLQAAIAAAHDQASRAEDTDWLQILGLYDLLRRMSSSPVVRLNHAVAAAMVHGPARGLELLAELESDPQLSGHYRLHAARAHLLERAGRAQAAAASYRVAAQKTANMPERNYLMMRAARLAPSVQSGA